MYLLPTDATSGALLTHARRAHTYNIRARTQPRRRPLLEENDADPLSVGFSELLLDPGNGTGALSRSRLSISRFDDDPSLIDRGDECVFDSNVDARSIVLRKCDQYEPLPFHECYPER